MIFIRKIRFFHENEYILFFFEGGGGRSNLKLFKKTILKNIFFSMKYLIFQYFINSIYIIDYKD